MQDEAWTTDEILTEAQVWVRRLACICFAVMIVAEVITGKVRAGAFQTCSICDSLFALCARGVDRKTIAVSGSYSCPAGARRLLGTMEAEVFMPAGCVGFVGH